MGVSTDAKLFYGVLIDEDSTAHDRITSYTESEDDSAEKNNPLGHMAYMGTNDGGVGLVYHCSSNFPMYAVAIRGSETIARRGRANAIDALTKGEDWDEKLRAFCEKHGITWEQPRWLLVSYWG